LGYGIARTPDIPCLERLSFRDRLAHRVVVKPKRIAIFEKTPHSRRQLAFDTPPLIGCCAALHSNQKLSSLKRAARHTFDFKDQAESVKFKCQA